MMLSMQVVATPSVLKQFKSGFSLLGLVMFAKHHLTRFVVSNTKEDLTKDFQLRMVVTQYKRKLGIDENDVQGSEHLSQEQLNALIEERRQFKKLDKPRIMIVGETGAGKSSLVNTVFGGASPCRYLIVTLPALAMGAQSHSGHQNGRISSSKFL